MIKLKHILQESVEANIVSILTTLHGFSTTIKFSVEDVNGYLNIVYDDPKALTQDVLKQLQDRKFWNTDFAPTVGKFPNGRVNIVFAKNVQDALKIQDFDKKNWSPSKV
ncbi:MAG: hypothetical protein EBR82_72155 [Caulobacteraceae bacterium]|nr:hypothetical protein [Caulobacteraceae bacterium]